MDLRDYSEKKKRLADSLRGLGEASGRLGLSKRAAALEESVSSLAAEGFRLVVVGEFSRGKSTFVNAMLGREILPSSAKATTAVISKIIYGEEPSFSLHYRDGQVETLDEQSFLKFRAPKAVRDTADQEALTLYQKASERQATVEYAEVVYPLPFCRDQVEVIDTPGTNDISAARVEITYGYLNQADAAIMVLAANQPLTSSELQFLRERLLGNQIEDIVVAVNFKDTLSHQSEMRVKKYIQDKFHEYLPELQGDIPVFLLSSYQALHFRRHEAGESLTMKQEMNLPESLEETGILDFESYLASFLTEKKGSIKLRRYARVGRAAVQELEKSIHDRIALLGRSADELREKYAQLQPEFLRVESSVKRIISDAKVQLGAGAGRLESACSQYRAGLKSAVDGAAAEHGGETKVSVIEAALKKAAGEAQKEFIEQIIKEEQELIGEARQRAYKRLETVLGSMETAYQKTFELAPVELEAEEPEVYLGHIEEYNSYTSQMVSETIHACHSNSFIEGIFDFCGVVGAGMIGVVRDVFSNRESVVERVRKKYVEAYDAEAQKMAKSLPENYAAETERLLKELLEVAQGRVDDKRSQITALLKEKAAREKDAAAEKEKLLAELATVRGLAKGLEV